MTTEIVGYLRPPAEKKNVCIPCDRNYDPKNENYEESLKWFKESGLYLCNQHSEEADKIIKKPEKYKLKKIVTVPAPSNKSYYEPKEREPGAEG